MPSITLRIPEADYETLREMARWKEVSLSDLIREYSRAGVRQDAANTSIRERIEKQIEEETKRLQRVRAFMEQTVGSASSDPLPEPTPAPAAAPEAAASIPAEPSEEP
jgi:predicted CopG family antitoxin